MQKNSDKKRLSIFLTALMLISFTVANSFAQGAGRRQISEGNKFYTEGKFDEANNKYRDAEVSNPESPIVHFNIGDALYKKRKYEEALQAYQKALQKSDEVSLQAQSYYNMGNTLFRLNKWPESLLAYQQALKLNPNDEDAKYNLEYVRAKIKEHAQKQPQDQQQQQQQQQDQQQSNSDQHNQQDQQQDQQQNQPDQPQPDEKQQEQQQQAGQQKKDKEQLNKEDAARLLEALKNQEKEAQKQRQMKAQGRVRVEKDW
jgi:Ca-activated chloride channel family protein